MDIGGYKIFGRPNLFAIIAIAGTGYLCYARHTIWPAVIVITCGLIIVGLALLVKGVVSGNDAQGR